VTPTTSGASISNTATVSGGGDPACPNASNCTSTVVTPVDAPQLTLQKTASAASFVIGVPASYTLQVTNTGTAATTALATITDVVPASLALGSMPSGCSAAGQTVTCAVASGLATNAVVTFVIPVTPTTSGSVSNTATVSGGGDPGCPNAPNCTSTILTPVAAPQLTMLKTASAGTFSVGVPASYTLQVTNTGSAATTSLATIADAVPATLALGSLPGGCNAIGQNLTCTIPSGLATGSAVSFVVPVTPTSAAGGTSVTNTATVSGGGDPGCPNASNCTSVVTTPVTSVATSADLRIVKAGPASIVAGTNIVYTITLTNLGPDAAVNAILSDPAPAGLTFVSSGAPCSAFPCSLGTLALNQSITIPNVTFHVPAGYGSGSIVNVASAISDTPDPTPNNNSSTVSTPLIASVQPVPTPINGRWMLLLLSLGLLTVVAQRMRKPR
jgi:uncharacterized repeat protein (TIGR01451 family)